MNKVSFALIVVVATGIFALLSHLNSRAAINVHSSDAPVYSSAGNWVIRQKFSEYPANPGTGWRQVESYQGTDLASKISACFADLPYSGICDARNIAGEQKSRGFTIPSRCTLLLGSIHLLITSPILMASDSSLIGLGWQSVLQATSQQPFFPDHGSALITNIDRSSGNARLRVADLKLDANADENPGLYYISGIRFIKTINSIVERVWSIGASGDSACGVRFEFGNLNSILYSLSEKSSNIGFSIAGEKGFLIEGNIARENGGNGFDVGTTSAQGKIVDNEAVANGLSYANAAGIGIDGAGDVTISNNSLQQNMANSGAGIVISNPQRYILISDNRIQGNKGDGIAFINNVTHGIVTGNMITGNAMRGLLLNGASNLVISGNVVADNSTSASKRFDGIFITATRSSFTSKGNLITGNVLTDSQDSTGQNFAIREDATARGVVGEEVVIMNRVPRDGAVSLLSSSEGTSRKR